jgi:hypothetical protein
MKAYVNVLILGFTTLTYSQEKNTGPMNMENLPAVVIKSGDDFSVYLPDRNADPKVRALQDSFIAYDLGVNYEGYDTYLVYMEIKGGSLSATYNENGKLISVVENYKTYYLASNMKFIKIGWQIVNDKYLYSQKKETS